jgi:hypothetical protein
MKNLEKLFLLMAALVLLASCNGVNSEEINALFVRDLSALVNMSQEDAYKYTYSDEYVGWMQNTELGIYANSRKELVELGTSNGEPYYKLGKERPSIKWVEPIGETKMLKCTKSSYVVIYGSGSAGTIGRLLKTEDTICAFARSYFGESTADVNVLHLNFHSTSVPVDLVDVGSYGISMRPLQFDWDNSVGYTQNLRPVDDGKVVRSEVLIFMNNLYNNADQIGFTVEQELINALVNEKVGVMANQHSPTSPENSPNESFSTIVSHLAAFDQKTASMVLGDYQSFVNHIAEEMAILTEIANR